LKNAGEGGKPLSRMGPGCPTGDLHGNKPRTTESMIALEH